MYWGNLLLALMILPLIILPLVSWAGRVAGRDIARVRRENHEAMLRELGLWEDDHPDRANSVTRSGDPG